MRSNPDTVEILADASRGIYAPQHVVTACNVVPLPDCGEQAEASLFEAIDIVREGPAASEDYWEAWNEIERNGCLRLGDRTWRIYQDGDVFAVELSSEGDAWFSEQEG